VPDLTQFVTDWGYLGIVVVVILGNIGLPVPEETVLALAGYLVWSGRLHLLPVILVGIVSAVAGDSLGYALGRRYGRRSVERLAQGRLGGARVAAAERLIARYGAVAVCGARFVGGLRFLAGPLAGAIGLPLPAFVFGNVLGAILFVPYAVTIGYGVGYGVGPYLSSVQHLERNLVIGAVLVTIGGLAWSTMNVVRGRRRSPPP
jgi:membrane protein DedA with SNARE-associated domain